MKRSETPKDLLDARNDYIKARWGQLCEMGNAVSEEAIKYLLFVNAAGLAGTLGFIGAMSQLRTALWPRLALLSFALGVVVLGIYHAVRYHRTEWLFKGWRDDVRRYNSDSLEWNDVLDADDARVSRWWGTALTVLAYVSFAGFATGMGTAASNFNDIAVSKPQGESYERARSTEAATAPAAKPAGAKNDPIVGAGQAPHSSAKPPDSR
jgi:hypothetical protein